ncbi:MAG: hypothetical protein PVJ80_08165 [Gemmatimonadota bacterium]|jgi:vacuolar-type H+-ATPase subunit H
MDVDETIDPGGEPRQASQLNELLACEQELARLLEETRAEARRLVEDARAAAGEAAANLEASLEEESERERARIREETQARIRALVAAAREESARFDSVGDDRVSELAESALRRLLSKGPSS